MSSPTETMPRPRVRPARATWRIWLALVLVGGLAGAVGVWARGRSAGDTGHPAGVVGRPGRDATKPRVEVVRPRQGGIERRTVQPGSIHSFETVELFSMVSGYLKTQAVDIGSRVTRGQVLAEIDSPREAKVAAEAEALLEQARAQSLQAEARVKAMEAERDTAIASVAQVEADIDRLVANHRLADSQYERVRSLHENNAIERRLVDEQRRDQEAAQAAERTGRLTVQTTQARLLGAAAKVDQARADVAEARAMIGVAQARLDKARVDLDYARIVAPFDGVVTRRSFHPGAFIRSAAEGNQTPLLTVSRTDLMRVVIRVPDRDVVLASAGDPVVVTIDGLDRREFRGVVARIGESQDPTSRTMRVEVDLPNPDDLLREGMYGRAIIELEPASQRLTVPAACVLDRTGKGEGTIQVVRGGKLDRSRVTLGADNGTLVEVASGVGPDDLVVLRSSVPLDPGMDVITEPAR